ncbi:MAG TPA: 4-alpha-glucanotransferase [Candidatus Acidoferrales bacterium]|nr:4-alpha-glucanotransferase [Candidatus Acidoferrales bacterium]
MLPTAHAARSSGILLHPTSLPGRFGIGDLGPEAHRFVDFLAAAGQSLWQVLPLGPTGYGDSPYQSFSAFAGNPLLVSPDALVADGLLAESESPAAPSLADARVDFGAAIASKDALLARVAAGLESAPPAELRAFVEREADWLEPYALFMAIKEERGGAPWFEWPAPLRLAERGALEAARARLAPGVHRQRVAQWLFARQWAALRTHATGRGVAFVGDAPLYVALDSADVWARPELFLLDGDRRPTFVAGVPPDYFSATGQLWGNPLYRWDVMAADGHAWWCARLAAQRRLVDRVRLDHFIGLVRGWQVPAGAADARGGAYAAGPGAALLSDVTRSLGSLALIAEDLGVVTPEVVALRERFGLPGMKVLQFAFDGGDDNPFLPHAHERNAVVYTGTHDNDTTAGWWATAPEATRTRLRRYVGHEVHDPAATLLRLGSASVAADFVAPMQDALGLGTEARMNLPGRAADNWSWRLRAGTLDDALAARLRELAATYDRLPR